MRCRGTTLQRRHNTIETCRRTARGRNTNNSSPEPGANKFLGANPSKLRGPRPIFCLVGQFCKKSSHSGVGSIIWLADPQTCSVFFEVWDLVDI